MLNAKLSKSKSRKCNKNCTKKSLSCKSDKMLSIGLQIKAKTYRKNSTFSSLRKEAICVISQNYLNRKLSWPPKTPIQLQRWLVSLVEQLEKHIGCASRHSPCMSNTISQENYRKLKFWTLFCKNPKRMNSRVSKTQLTLCSIFTRIFQRSLALVHLFYIDKASFCRKKTPILKKKHSLSSHFRTTNWKMEQKIFVPSPQWNLLETLTVMKLWATWNFRPFP